MQGNEQALTKVNILEQNDISLDISAVSQFELYHSLERVDNPKDRRKKIDSVLDSRQAYPADSAVMKKAGRIDGRLASDGAAIGIGDTIIASTALIHEEPVFTKNVSHFERIEGLDVETF